MLITGRVLHDAAHALPQAQVAVLVWPALPTRLDPFDDPEEVPPCVAACSSVDAEGYFRVPVDREPATLSLAAVVAGGEGHGLAWHSVQLAPEQPEVVLRLRPEQLLRGQLVDERGAPAAGVRLDVVEIGRHLSGGNTEYFSFVGCLVSVDPQDDATLDQTPPDPNPLVPSFAHPFYPDRLRFPEHPEGLPCWPGPVTTDAQGQFVLRGVDRRLAVRLDVRDGRFARQFLDARRRRKRRVESIQGVLVSSRLLEGRVVAEDTGAPVADAYVHVSVEDDRGREGTVNGRTDGTGRFQMSPHAGRLLHVKASASRGQPYHPQFRELEWSAGSAEQQLDLVLRRGVLLRGRVVEAPARTPVAGAAVHLFAPAFQEAVTSAADGRFELVGPYGGGCVVVNAGSPAYVPQAVGTGELDLGKPGGPVSYHHALVRVRPGSHAGPLDMTVTLRRGVTLWGRLLGPDGKPVPRWPWFDAVLLYGGHPLAFCIAASSRCPEPCRIKAGRFAIFGCDPGQAYRLFFVGSGAWRYSLGGSLCEQELGCYAFAHRLEVRRQPALEDSWAAGLVTERWGAMVEVPAGEVGAGPITVRLQPCGSATVRFVDPYGKPVVGHEPGLQLVLSPGPAPRQALASGRLAGETVWLLRSGGDDGLGQELSSVTDPTRSTADGRLTFFGLIPGATYRLRAEGRAEEGATLELDFAVAAGQQRRLPDVTVKRGRS